MAESGEFIVFEGIDGCGKSTQARMFGDYLFQKDKNNHVVMTRNPYHGNGIRQLLMNTDNPYSDDEALTNLFIDDRRLFVRELVTPNLEQSHYIVCDRYKLSTIAYQAAQGMNLQNLIERQRDLIVPDITFIIDMSVETALKRMAMYRDDSDNAKEVKFESQADFIEKVRAKYHIAAESLDGENIQIVDGDKGIEGLHSELVERYEFWRGD